MTKYTPFASSDGEVKVARSTKSDPINTASVRAGSNTSEDRIATNPVPASADKSHFTESAKLGDRISGPAPGSVVVARGDTLYSIARRHRVRLNDLMAINNIASPTSLRTGQKLQLPSGEASARPVAISYRHVVADPTGARRPARLASIIPTAGTGPRRVTLTSGTTLYSLARSNGITVAELARANGISDPARIPAGTVLTIPDPGAATTPSVRTASLAQGQFIVEDVEPVTTGAVPATDRDPGALERRREKKMAAAIATYKRAANDYRVTPGQTILVPF